MALGVLGANAALVAVLTAANHETASAKIKIESLLKLPSVWETALKSKNAKICHPVKLTEDLLNGKNGELVQQIVEKAFKKAKDFVSIPNLLEEENLAKEKKLGPKRAKLKSHVQVNLDVQSLKNFDDSFGQKFSLFSFSHLTKFTDFKSIFAPLSRFALFCTFVIFDLQDIAL